MVAPAEGVALWWRVRSLEAVVLLVPPPIWFDGPALAVALALALVSLVALLRGRSRHPAPRLLAMLAMLVVFAKLFLLPDVALPFHAPPGETFARDGTEQLAEALDAALAAAPAPLSTEIAAYGPALELLGALPFLHKGAPVGGFRLELRQGCTGPAAPAEGAAPGTILLCATVDGRGGWLTVQGVDERLGRPSPLRDEGGSLWSLALRGGGPAGKG